MVIERAVIPHGGELTLQRHTDLTLPIFEMTCFLELPLLWALFRPTVFFHTGHFVDLKCRIARDRVHS